MTEVRVFNFEDKGFGKINFFGGKENEPTPDGHVFSSTMLEYET